MEVDQLNSQILHRNKSRYWKATWASLRKFTSSKVSNNEGEDESVVLNKSGKGTAPYQKHKELRVENHLTFE